ncbi:MAG: hypothetical protein JSV78_00575 [Phycisphaerales bacterium]|nr:MAG: hypothetical protein JSV78_00575 [Phycisphaerales bacterium]
MTRDEITTPETDCPKRGWVIQQLADDVAMDGFDDLPQGLQFHLNRCESCRAFADRLLSLSGELHSLGRLEVPEGLEERAQAQAVEALEQGGELTGRVTIEEDVKPVPVPPMLLWWNRTGWYAAAACLLLAVALYAFFHRPAVEETGSSDRPIAVAPSDWPDSEDAASAPRSEEKVAIVPEPRHEQAVKPPAPQRRYGDHVAAAEAAQEGAAQPAFILPDRSKRDPRSIIDKSEARLSTMPGQPKSDDR